MAFFFLIREIREIQPDLIEADYWHLDTSIHGSTLRSLRIRNGLVESRSPRGAIARDRLGRFIQTVSGPRSESGGWGGITWIRYHPDGTLDESFFYGPAEGLWPIGTQSSGSVIAVGRNPDHTGRLVRLRASPPDTAHRFSIGSASFVEHERTAVLQVTRSGSTAGAAAVRLRTQDITARAGEDYQAIDRVVEFAPLEVFKDVPIELRQDAFPEDLERFGVILEAAGVPPVENMVYIWDDDLLLRLDLQSASSGQIQVTVTIPATVITSGLGNIHLQASSDLRTWRSIATNRWDYEVRKFITPDQEQLFLRAVVVNP